MKYTNLELVQSILSSMDSDEINSVDDTVESQQVLEVLKTVYDDIVSRTDLNANKIPFNLTASTDPTKPIMMSKPESIDRIEWVKYNVMKDVDTVPVWNTLRWLSPEDFIDYMHSYNEGETNVATFDHTVNGFTITFIYRNDTAPHFYTSFNDVDIFFNAYDAAVDTTLQSSKTVAFGLKASDFVKTDGYVPNLQPQQFALLLNEAKSLAWAELKQTVHAKAEQTAKRNWRHIQKVRQQVINTDDIHSNASSFDKLPNFARMRR